MLAAGLSGRDEGQHEWPRDRGAEHMGCRRHSVRVEADVPDPGSRGETAALQLGGQRVIVDLVPVVRDLEVGLRRGVGHVRELRRDTSGHLTRARPQSRATMRRRRSRRATCTSPATPPLRLIRPARPDPPLRQVCPAIVNGHRWAAGSPAAMRVSRMPGIAERVAVSRIGRCMARSIWTGAVAFGLVNVPVAPLRRHRGQDRPLQPVPSGHVGPDQLQAGQREHGPRGQAGGYRARARGRQGRLCPGH